MASNKQVLDILPAKGAYPAAVGDEQTRNWSERQWDYQLQKEGATYDRTRTHLNFEIAPGGKIVPMGTNKKIGDRFKERCAELGLGDPNFKKDKNGKLIPTNRVTTAWIQFGGSREQMHLLAFGDQKVDLEDGADNSHITRKRAIEQWALAQYRFACKQWGEENIIGFNIHLDELNPHCHCTVIPVAMIKGKPNISFNNAFYTPKNMRQRLSALHDELAEVNKPFGLERGDKVSQTGAKHRTKDEYLREKAQMEKVIKGLTTMIANLTARRDELEKEIHKLNLKHGTKIHGYEVQIYQWQCELEKVKAKLAEKQALLDSKQAQLLDMENKLKSLSQNIDRIEQRVQKSYAAPELQLLGCEAIITLMINSFHDVWMHTNTSIDEENYMDDSFAAAVIAKSDKVLKCALYLFLGLVDDATTFAETQGGGGSSSDLPWRDRDKDEDEAAFMRRCIIQAAKLLKPHLGFRLKRKGGGMSR